MISDGLCGEVCASAPRVLSNCEKRRRELNLGTMENWRKGIVQGSTP